MINCDQLLARNRYQRFCTIRLSLFFLLAIEKNMNLRLEVQLKLAQNYVAVASRRLSSASPSLITGNEPRPSDAYAETHSRPPNVALRRRTFHG